MLDPSNEDEFEPNDDYESPTFLAFDTDELSGTLCGGDEDWFVFDNPIGLAAVQGRSEQLGLRLTVFNRGGILVGEDPGMGSGLADVEVPVDDDELYPVRVKVLAVPSGFGAYRLTFLRTLD